MEAHNLIEVKCRTINRSDDPLYGIFEGKRDRGNSMYALGGEGKC